MLESIFKQKFNTIETLVSLLAEKLHSLCVTGVK